MVHHRKKKIALGLGSLLGKAAPYVAFLQQISAKDMEILSPNRSYMQQGKDLTNIITGRMAGFSIFKAPSDYKVPFTINPAAILQSKWVQGGAGMIGYQLLSGIINKRVGKTILPKGGTIGSIGKKIMFGGAIGALFDAPGSSNPKDTNYVAPAPVELIQRNNVYRESNFTSYDSQYIPQYQAPTSRNNLDYEIPMMIDGGLN